MEPIVLAPVSPVTDRPTSRRPSSAPMRGGGTSCRPSSAGRVYGGEAWQTNFFAARPHSARNHGLRCTTEAVDGRFSLKCDDQIKPDPVSDGECVWSQQSLRKILDVKANLELVTKDLTDFRQEFNSHKFLTSSALTGLREEVLQYIEQLNSQRKVANDNLLQDVESTLLQMRQGLQRELSATMSDFLASQFSELLHSIQQELSWTKSCILDNLQGVQSAQLQEAQAAHQSICNVYKAVQNFQASSEKGWNQTRDDLQVDQSALLQEVQAAHQSICNVYSAVQNFQASSEKGWDQTRDDLQVGQSALLQEVQSSHQRTCDIYSALQSFQGFYEKDQNKARDQLKVVLSDQLQSVQSAHQYICNISNEFQKFQTLYVEDLKHTRDQLEKAHFAQLHELQSVQADQKHTRDQLEKAHSTQSHKIQEGQQQTRDQLEKAIGSTQELRTAQEKKISEVIQAVQLSAELHNSCHDSLKKALGDVHSEVHAVKSSQEARTREVLESVAKAVDEINRVQRNSAGSLKSIQESVDEINNFDRNEVREFHKKAAGDLRSIQGGVDHVTSKILEELQQLQQVQSEQVKEVQSAHQSIGNVRSDWLEFLALDEKNQTEVRESMELLKKAAKNTMIEFHDLGTNVTACHSEVHAAKSSQEACKNDILASIERAKDETSTFQVSTARDLNRIQEGVIEASKVHTNEMSQLQSKTAGAFENIQKVVDGIATKSFEELKQMHAKMIQSVQLSAESNTTDHDKMRKLLGDLHSEISGVQSSQEVRTKEVLQAIGKVVDELNTFDRTSAGALKSIHEGVNEVSQFQRSKINDFQKIATGALESISGGVHDSATKARKEFQELHAFCEKKNAEIIQFLQHFAEISNTSHNSMRKVISDFGGELNGVEFEIIQTVQNSAEVNNASHASLRNALSELRSEVQDAEASRQNFEKMFLDSSRKAVDQANELRTNIAGLLQSLQGAVGEHATKTSQELQELQRMHGKSKTDVLHEIRNSLELSGSCHDGIQKVLLTCHDLDGLRGELEGARRSQERFEEESRESLSNATAAINRVQQVATGTLERLQVKTDNSASAMLKVFQDLQRMIEGKIHELLHAIRQSDESNTAHWASEGKSNAQIVQVLSQLRNEVGEEKCTLANLEKTVLDSAQTFECETSALQRKIEESKGLTTKDCSDRSSHWSTLRQSVKKDKSNDTSHRVEHRVTTCQW